MALHRETWLGAWQQAAVDLWLSHEDVATKQPRQTGKTHALRRVMETSILAGQQVVVAAPTLQQSTRLLLRGVKQSLGVTAPFFGIRPVVNNTLEMQWSNGGGLVALSMTPESQKEGYTCDLLVIDEAHRARRDEHSILLPMLTQAKRRGGGRQILTGIGGTNDGLLEQSYQHMGFTLHHLTPDAVVEADATYAPVFEGFRQQMTAREYAQHIECANLGEGLHQAYPFIADAVEFPREAQQVPRRLTFGIDVGWVTDETVVVVIESIPGWSVANVIGVHYIQGGDFAQQAEMIFEVIDSTYRWVPERIGVEWNGGGAGLYYALHRERFFPGCQRVAVSHKVKFGAVLQVQRAFEQGRLGIADDRMRLELQSLQIDYKGVDEDRWEITHSDCHSALLVAVAMGGLG